ncbi:MAG: hypothetical protein FJ109_05440 [Deltaproteobacteria bacterium]|nr:hypothetical protein [Deltaproteobacteria bacterium]
MNQAKTVRPPPSLASGAVALELIAIIVGSIGHGLARGYPLTQLGYWYAYAAFVVGIAAALTGFVWAVRGWRRNPIMSSIAVLLGLLFFLDHAHVFGLEG